jgi:adenosylcobinamide-GDP ribazoletransferase
MTQTIRQLAAAIGLLTRLPIWRLVSAAPENFAASAWAWPIVGGLTGGLASLVFALCISIGLSPPLAACWTLAAQMLITGALHEDGLADTADGLFGGRTRERKLEIMRDSRIGSYGALALIVSSALRLAALIALATPGRVAVALIVAGCVARAAMLGLAAATKPARSDGMAAGLAYVPALSVAVGLASALVLSACLLGTRCVPAWLAAALLAGAMRWWTLRQIGGQTGDVLGALALVSEVLVLSVLTAQM